MISQEVIDAHGPFAPHEIEAIEGYNRNDGDNIWVIENAIEVDARMEPPAAILVFLGEFRDALDALDSELRGPDGKLSPNAERLMTFEASRHVRLCNRVHSQLVATWLGRPDDGRSLPYLLPRDGHLVLSNGAVPLDASAAG